MEIRACLLIVVSLKGRLFPDNMNSFQGLNCIPFGAKNDLVVTAAHLTGCRVFFTADHPLCEPPLQFSTVFLFRDAFIIHQLLFPLWCISVAWEPFSPPPHLFPFFLPPMLSFPSLSTTAISVPPFFFYPISLQLTFTGCWLNLIMIKSKSSVCVCVCVWSPRGSVDPDTWGWVHVFPSI